jgi:Fe-S-cluster containining protein
MIASGLVRDLKDFYNQFDMEVEKRFDSRIVCKKGCVVCCSRTESYGLPVEAVYAVVYLNHSLLSKEEKKALSDKIKVYDDTYNLATKLGGFRQSTGSVFRYYNHTSSIQISCPFLDDKGACMIYPARPLICRAFISHSLSECKDRNPAIMEQRVYQEFLRESYNKLSDLNREFFIALGESPVNVAPVPLPRFIDYNDDEFVLVWKRKKIRIRGTGL